MMKRRLNLDGTRKSVTGLVTLVLLLSMLGTLSSTVVPDCCRGKVCPIHQKHASPIAAERSHMECGHEDTGLNRCSVSCSHREDGQLQTTVVFLLPDVSPSFELLPVGNTNLVPSGFGLNRSVRPVVPPPRFQVFSL